ncbi:MAG: mechanosensitive ion channel [Deltaproteobacteria bacterium]|nr:mechanosensitive ion channel [Deltaproteobacteria bacterium]
MRSLNHRLSLILAFIFALLIPAGAQPVMAQDGEDPESATAIEAEPAVEEIAEASAEDPALDAAMKVWTEAWRATPRLVSLKGVEGDASSEGRIKLLGEKTFSNREWKSYWELQGETATALGAALEAAGAPADRVEATGAWAALAADKVVNQERYFAAIQSERDAVEDRMEAALDPVVAESADLLAPQDELNPHQARRRRIEDLEGRIEAQRSKRSSAEAELVFVEGQLEGEEVLSEALATDLELARRELAIAQGQSGSAADGWEQTWSTIAAASTSKVDAIAAEVDATQVRIRSRKVEIELGRSQLAFRDRRIAEYQAEYEAESSFKSLVESSRLTAVEFAKARAWRVLLVLLLIVVAVRLVLRLLGRGVKVVLKRMDNDPNRTDASDQRRQTLADVFTSVTRLAVYTVAGLIALEEVGVNTAPLLGSVAILGLAVSFGSQNLVRDVVNGFFILLENQFAVGDVVTIGGKTGTVERITIRSTWIVAYSGDVHVLPNGTIGLVSNQTRGWSRAVCDVGVGYGADLGHVRDVITRVGEEMKEAEDWAEMLDEVPAWVGVTSLGDSAVVVRTAAKVTAGSQWAVERELNQRLKVAFDAEGIEIPFPQQVVHRPTDAAEATSEG